MVFTSAIPLHCMLETGSDAFSTASLNTWKHECMLRNTVFLVYLLHMLRGWYVLQHNNCAGIYTYTATVNSGEDKLNIYTIYAGHAYM